MRDIVLELQNMKYLNWEKTRKSSGTAGSFLKSYDDTGHRKIYYKLSDYDIRYGIIGHECVNEIIAQRLLVLLGIPHLEYTLVHALIEVDGKESETYLCQSYDFKEFQESKLPMEDYFAMERECNESPMEFCKRMKWEEIIYDMFVVDFLILNRDRHGANIEVLINRKEKRIRMAPFFDQGLSFVCRCHDMESLQKFDVMQDLRIQSFAGTNSSFENLKIVPKEYLKKYRAIGKEDRDYFFEGMDSIMDQRYFDKIWEMLERRWNYLDSFRNS